MSSGHLRETKKAQTRLAITRAALRLFLERGFEAVSVAQIAAAAKVSKMTVFNYFPAKEDILLDFAHGRQLPDFATAIRQRQAGTSPLAAVHALFRRDLARHAEWTGLHDGVAKFARVIFESPTLLNAYKRLWGSIEAGLGAALAEAQGAPSPPLQALEQWPDSATEGAGDGDGKTAAARRNEILAGLTPEGIRIRLTAAQIVAVIQQLCVVNMARQAVGQSAAATEETALQEADDAFRLLREGLGSLGF